MSKMQGRAPSSAGVSFTASARHGKRVSGGIWCLGESGGALAAGEQLEPSRSHSCGELSYSASKMTFFCASLIRTWNNADIVSAAGREHPAHSRCTGAACGAPTPAPLLWQQGDTERCKKSP